MRLLQRISGKGLLAVALWGLSFVWTRVALGSFSPFGLVAVRLLTGTIFLAVIVAWGGQGLLPEKSDRRRCILLGIILGVHLQIQAIGLQHTSAINTAWIIGFIPVCIAIGAHVLGKQRISGIGWVGILAGALGVLIVTLSAQPDFANARWGDSLQILSCFTWTAYTLLSVRPIAQSGALRVTAVSSAVAMFMIAGVTPFIGVYAHEPTLPAWASVLALGICCSGLAYLLWSHAIAEHGPARTGSLLYLEPFFTLGAAVWFLHEKVTLYTLFGGLGVLFGVWLVARGTHINPHRSDLAVIIDQQGQ